MWKTLALADCSTQRPHSRQGRESAGRLAPRLEAIYSPLSIVTDTVRLSWRGRLSHPLAFRRFFDLRGFASLPFHCRRLNFRFAAKRRKSKKVGHIPVPASRGRAPAATCDNQQNALGPLTSRQKRNAADARPWVEDIRWPCPRATLLRSHAPTARGRASRCFACGERSRDHECLVDGCG